MGCFKNKPIKPEDPEAEIEVSDEDEEEDAEAEARTEELRRENEA